jgi:hypothetical protein
MEDTGTDAPADGIPVLDPAGLKLMREASLDHGDHLGRRDRARLDPKLAKGKSQRAAGLKAIEVSLALQNLGYKLESRRLRHGSANSIQWRRSHRECRAG